MKNLPFIPDEVVSAEDRALVYTLENYARLPHNCLELFAVIDKLAAAYLDVARERNQWKNVCELATDEEFWKAMEELKKQRRREACTSAKPEKS